MGNDLRHKRNSFYYEFDLKEIDVDLILSLNVIQLREGLLKGTFTSVDLVTVFGERTQRLGRDLQLSAEENFEEAFEMAKKRDEQIEDAR